MVFFSNFYLFGRDLPNIQARLPPLNFSLQPAALSLWLRSGSWLTPTRGNPDCHVTERSWLGKRERAISRARSINWGARGACVRLDKKALKVQRFPASRFPLPASRFPLNAQRSTLKAQRPTFTVYGWGGEQGHCPAEGHAVQPRWSADKDEQVVGRGRKSRGFSRGLEFETRSDAHAPPKRGARCL